VHNQHTVTKLKMVSLYDFMLEPFKHNGRYVVMDSAYMSDVMCQVGREEWKINRIQAIRDSEVRTTVFSLAKYTH
jgi:hypothetical protein